VRIVRMDRLVLRPVQDRRADRKHRADRRDLCAAELPTAAARAAAARTERTHAQAHARSRTRMIAIESA
jgi:hypothetical protein